MTIYYENNNAFLYSAGPGPDVQIWDDDQSGLTYKWPRCPVLLYAGSLIPNSVIGQRAASQPKHLRSPPK